MNFDPNNIDPKSTGEFYAMKKQIDKLAIDYLSATPDGVFGGGVVVGSTIRKFPLKGTALAVGFIFMLASVSRVGWSAFMGVIAPAPIPQNAPIPDRIGNGLGRVTNVVLTTTKPAFAPVAADYFKSFENGTVTPAVQPQEPGSNMPGLVQVSNTQGSATKPNIEGLTPQQQQAIEALFK